MCWFICSNAEWSMEGLELRVQIMWNRIVFPSLWFHINRFARKEDIFFYLWCEQFTLYVDFSGCFESETEQSYFSKTNANTFFEGRRTCKMKYHLLYFYHLPKSFTNEGIFAWKISKKYSHKVPYRGILLSFDLLILSVQTKYYWWHNFDVG